ncbi:DEAD/DEAH box helicase [Methanobrevibacter ruminantium]|uniref:DEAD/DEAH box helicase n=1 Tax=Methanobrevibacter ruminantium TaxID=83816 RepID=UPI002D7F5160|nr:DEAD/DEAH box helicase [Methanobrevibacter ruminantium]
MNKDIDKIILEGAETAFINGDYESSSEYRPRLLVNSKGHKVLNSIKDELNNCEEFYISVAFITMGGLTPLLQDLKELEKKGVKGKIITTDYLFFTEPEALRKLNDLSNLEIKLYETDETDGFHTKGYIFKNNDIYKAIVGSSNLTLNALTINKEWNIGFSSLYDGEILKSLIEEFDDLWKKSSNIDDIIVEYENIYNYKKNFRDFNRDYKEIKEETEEELAPNSMQRDFLKELRTLVLNGQDRALLVSATGTGKTYAAAFAVKDFAPRKFLFIVHREQILNQAIKSFKRVFNGEDDKFGLLSGNSKEYEKDYLFSTVQTMSKDDVYTKFDQDEFDFIVIDEVHKAGAFSYKKLLNYFKPQFWLGMTASPDRTDGENIYELFDYNVPLDIRLQDALKEDLLCPFHYFGISDLTVNGEVLDDESDFRYLVSNERVNYLLEKSEYYGHTGDRCKALVFCSTKREARELADAFTQRGHDSVFLSGDNSQDEREEAIYRLTSDDARDPIEYIFTVDIFNEGVDIPEVNQVLLVRPTQSSIIFIQQLGRGLRKFKNKEYVVIIDFIGNYKNNFLIPIALSGDRTYDKDNIRRYLMEGSKIIPGQSSISFDSISKKRIYEAINNTNFSRIPLFKEAYENLKFRLGRIPYLCDFYENGELDPSLILSHNSFDTYHNFLKKVEKEYKDELSTEEIRYLKFITDVFSDGKRPHELLILKLLIYNKFFTIRKLEECLKGYDIADDFKSIESSFNIFNLDFFITKDQEKYEGIEFFNLDIPLTFIDDSGNNFAKFDLSNRLEERFEISDKFKQFLSNPIFYRHVNDLIDYALSKYEYNHKFTDGHNLTLYAKYSRKDACRLLNWPHDDSSTMYGYRVKHNTCPIFVTYEKEEDISSSTKYQDEFISRDIFSWMTRSRVRLDSPEVKRILDEKTEIHIFVKHSDGEGKDFYYIGQANPICHRETTIDDDHGNKLPIVNFRYKLAHTCKEEIYNYFMDKLDEE